MGAFLFTDESKVRRRLFSRNKGLTFIAQHITAKKSSSYKKLHRNNSCKRGVNNYFANVKNQSLRARFITKNIL